MRRIKCLVLNESSVSGSDDDYACRGDRDHRHPHISLGNLVLRGLR